MFNLLVGPLSNLVGNAVKGFVETKKAKAELALTEIKAQKSLKEAANRRKNKLGSISSRSNEGLVERRANFDMPVGSCGGSLYSWMDSSY
ncbi:MAG: hypothetical protein CM15mV49_560 [uncultured marine virus]|nr:MAG: hypothetical protein CM15mV49_560 [uncultured marine virus]